MSRGRTIAWAVLMTAAIAAAVMFMSRRRRDSVAEPSSEPAEPAAQPSDDDETDEPTELARAPHAEAPAPARAAAVDSGVQANTPLQPPVRDHAKQIIIPTAALAMDKGDVKKLYTVLQVANDHRSDQLLAEQDKGAVEAAIACLEDAPEAREEARDLLRFGAPTALADNLRRACARR